MPLFTCMIYSSLFATQKELTAHAYNCAVRFAHEYHDQWDTQPIVQNEEMEDFEGLSMSESSMETDTSNVVSEESITQEEPVTYDWYPSEPIDQVKADWITIMQVLDEAKMPGEYQRRLAYVCSNVGPFANQHFQSPDTYRRMVQRDNKSTTKYDICPNGCYMYPANDTETSVCQVLSCDMPRFCNEAEVEAAREDGITPLPELKPTRQMAYTSVGMALTEFCVNGENNEMLSYREQFFVENSTVVDHYKDIFSGQCYKDLLDRGVVDDNTICLVIFVDGY